MTRPAPFRAAMTCVVVALVACTPPAPDKASIDSSVTRAAIASQISQSIEATRTKNIDLWLALLPEDVSVVSPEGDTLSRAAIREQVLTQWKRLKETRAFDVQIGSVWTHGDSATVFLTQHWDRLVIRPDGKTVDTLISDASRRETWRRTPKGWRSYAGVTTSSRTLVNGAVLTNIPELQALGKRSP